MWTQGLRIGRQLWGISNGARIVQGPTSNSSKPCHLRFTSTPMTTWYTAREPVDRLELSVITITIPAGKDIICPLTIHIIDLDQSSLTRSSLLDQGRCGRLLFHITAQTKEYEVNRSVIWTSSSTSLIISYCIDLLLLELITHQVTLLQATEASLGHLHCIQERLEHRQH